MFCVAIESTIHRWFSDQTIQHRFELRALELRSKCSGACIGGRWASVSLRCYHTFYVEYPVALIYSTLCTHIGLFMQNLVLNIRWLQWKNTVCLFHRNFSFLRQSLFFSVGSDFLHNSTLRSFALQAARSRNASQIHRWKDPGRQLIKFHTHYLYIYIYIYIYICFFWFYLTCLSYCLECIVSWVGRSGV